MDRPNVKMSRCNFLKEHC